MHDTTTTDPACQVCTRPVGDAFLCRGCLDQLVTELRTINWLVEQLTITLTRQARGNPRNGGRGTERPLPFHPIASVDLETLRDSLLMWARIVADRRGVTVDADGSHPEQVAAWLIRWAGEIAQHPDCAELHGDVLAMTRAARRTIDRPADMRFVGPCDAHQAAAVSDNYPQGCDKDLYVGMLASWVTCRTEGCGAVYPIEPRRIWLLEQAVDLTRTARQLAYELPWIAGVNITAKQIGMWAVRGKITRCPPHHDDPTGTQRFRVGEVIEVARAMAEAAAAKTSGAA